MAVLPPLRNIRKTTAVLLLVVFSFFVHRLIVFFNSETSIKDVENTELSLAQGSVCRHIVKETPFGVDSIFEEGSRLYFYTTVSSPKKKTDTLWHIWYYGTDTVQVLPCIRKNDAEACYTDILPKNLKPGEWSVDLVLGRKLLFSRQFVIYSPSR